MISNTLTSDFSTYIHISKYSKWIEEEHRRETWSETVSRYFSFMKARLKDKQGFDMPAEDLKQLEEAVFDLRVMPSMRALMTSGKALDRDSTCAYNCAYVAVDDVKVFDEILYILMNGTGIGFSVERQFVSQLPVIADHFSNSDIVIRVKDSKQGWAKGLRELVALLYAGQIPTWDISAVRPKGARLKTFGGRASGPVPLVNLFNFAVQLFTNAAGRKLSSLECHDLVCFIADSVVSGGVRRSALISLSNLSDDRMRNAKNGNWWENNVQRALANNSACYTETPDMGTFIAEWKALYDSHSGERGIFSRVAAKKGIDRSNKFREAITAITGQEFRFRDIAHEFGCNPCSEIILRSKQFCNLTEVIVTEFDTIVTLSEKVRIATILGTYQSTLTDFKYISKKWKENTEEERLLGVSFSGIMDNSLTNGILGIGNLRDALQTLRRVATETNAIWAERLGIPPSVAITCVKPSGTVSSLVNCAPGLHDRHSEYYIRTVREDKSNPLYDFMKSIGIPVEDDVTKPEYTAVFSFPIHAPENAIFKNDRTAVQQLEIWKEYQIHWCDHKPSVTINVKENEWLEVAAWVYKNFDYMSGVSFLPSSNTIYRQAPYQTITKEEYEAALAKMPKDVDWYGELQKFEKEDTTVGEQTLACAAGGCEI